MQNPIQNNIESILKQHSIIPVVTINDLKEIDSKIKSLLSKILDVLK